MISVELAKAKKADLDAELKLYSEGGIVDVKEFGVAGKNADKVAEITRLQKEHGVPVMIDQAFLDANAELAAIVAGNGDVLELGEIVFFSAEELASADEMKKEGAGKERQKLIAAISDLVAEGPTKADFVASVEALADEELQPLFEKMSKELQEKGGTTPAKPAEAQTLKAGAEYVWKGRTLSEVYSTIKHGKSFKVVKVGGETYDLTEEEFAKEVTIRG